MAANAELIMLVEDDPDMRGLIKTLLQIEGYRVVSFYDQELPGNAIVQMVRDQKPNALLLDANLPGISGLDVLREIRADSVLNPVRVILSSGMYLKREAMDAGAAYFLLKPYMPDELLACLHE